MSNSMVWRLIAKDLYLYRWLILGATVAAALSFAISPSPDGFGLRAILYITSVVALGIFVVMYGVLKERQDKSLLFVLSLPVSPMQYGVAKLTAALIAFFFPWLAVLIATVIAITASSAAGGLPFAVALMGLFLCNFCILLAVVMITLSEVWAVAGILATNMSISAYIPFVLRLPGIAEHQDGAVAVWTSTAITIIASEVAISVAAIALAFFVHSRKTDFV